MPLTGTTSVYLKGSPVSYNILYQDGEVKETVNQTSSVTTLICEVAFDDKYKFLWHMVGHSTVSGGYLSRILPERSSWNGDQYALSVDSVKFMKYTAVPGTIGGIPIPNGWPTFERVQYSVTFGAPLYEILEDSATPSSFDESTRFVLWSKNGAASNERVPGASFKFINANKDPLPEGPVRTGRTVSLEAKWLDVPEVNYTRIAGMSNRINGSAITLDGQLYPAETVLFESWSEAKKRTAFGQLVSDVTFKFLIRQDLDSAGVQRTWNKFWSKDGTTVEVSSDGTTGGVRVFQTANLLDLFKV